MRLVKITLLTTLGLALCLGPGCKKKKGASGPPPPAVAPPAPVAEPAPGGQQKIDPQAEADDSPRPAAADLSDDDQEEAQETPAAPVERNDAAFSAGTVGEVQLARLFADRFESLDRRDRALIYHLARAVLAGRDITFDQVHRDGLEVRQLVECVLRSLSRQENDVAAALGDYLQLLGIHSGFYDRLTGRKFVPACSFEDFSQVVRTAHAEGAEVNLQRDEQLEGMLARLKRTMFDAEHLPVLFRPRTNRAGESLVGTYLNLYRGVTRLALRRFEEHYPHNSRLINIDGKLVEEVYRAGDKRRKIPPGRYARELRRVIKRLNDAIASADRSHRLLFTDLIEHFRTGDPVAFEAVLRKWQEEAHDVEFVAGFLDRDWDPRGEKGLFSGLVGYRDRPASSKLDSLVRQVQHFEDRMPWRSRYHKHWRSAPVVAAIHLVTGVDDVAPICTFAYRLPPDRAMGERHARKVLLFTNAIESQRRTVGLTVARGFLIGPARERALAHLEETSFLLAALREVLGRDLGIVSPEVGSRLRGDLAVVEALKADLAALWLLADPKLAELGLISGQEAVLAGWEQAVAEALVLDSLAGPDIQSPEALARRIWIRQLVEEAKVVGFEEHEGNPYPQIPDENKFRSALEGLLKRSEKILAVADRQAAGALVRQWHEPSARPEWAAIAPRAHQAGLRPLLAFVMPKLRPLRNRETGRIWDATISFSEDLEHQLLRISRY